MTIGEKIKEARMEIGLSQEEFAGKLNVSRSAVAKWESDSGVPDIDNLKAIAKLLNVSLDYLLDENLNSDDVVIREEINLGDCKRSEKNKKKKEIIKDKFKDADIYLLEAEEKLTDAETTIDFLLMCIDHIIKLRGIFDLVRSINNRDKMFFLVEKEDKHLLVTVTDEYVETKQLKDYKGYRQFKTENWSFTKHRKSLK